MIRNEEAMEIWRLARNLIFGALLLAIVAKGALASQGEPSTFTPIATGPSTLCDCQDGQQWHLDFIHAREAWSITAGVRSVKVAVISSGIDTTARDVGGAWLNAGEIYNATDDDYNAQVDDRRGMNFSNWHEPSPIVADYGIIGTLEATVLAANGPEMSYRGVGVAPNVTVVPIKWFDGGIVGAADALIPSLAYARRIGCKIVVASSGMNYVWQPLKDELALCDAAGMLIVWAAGGLTPGGNIDQCPEPCQLPGTMYPQKYTFPGMLVVTCAAMVNGFGFQDMQVPTNTNWGPVSVDIAAPYLNANTLPHPIMPVELRSIMTTGPNEQWGSWSGGTQAAAAMVGGAAALVWSIHPGWTAAQVKAAILNNADAYPSLAGKCVTGGSLNVLRALQSSTTSVESRTPRPLPLGSFDVQGRRIDPAARSGVTFSGNKKRAGIK